MWTVETTNLERLRVLDNVSPGDMRRSIILRFRDYCVRKKKEFKIITSIKDLSQLIIEFDGKRYFWTFALIEESINQQPNDPINLNQETTGQIDTNVRTVLS